MTNKILKLAKQHKLLPQLKIVGYVANHPDWERFKRIEVSEKKEYESQGCDLKPVGLIEKHNVEKENVEQFANELIEKCIELVDDNSKDLLRNYWHEKN